MRFMMLMIPKGYESATPGTLPDAEGVARMMKYNESLQKAGVLLSLEGLHPPSMGARVSFLDDSKPENAAASAAPAIAVPDEGSHGVRDGGAAAALFRVALLHQRHGPP